VVLLLSGERANLTRVVPLLSGEEAHLIRVAPLLSGMEAYYKNGSSFNRRGISLNKSGSSLFKIGSSLQKRINFHLQISNGSVNIITNYKSCVTIEVILGSTFIR